MLIISHCLPSEVKELSYDYPMIIPTNDLITLYIELCYLCLTFFKIHFESGI